LPSIAQRRVNGGRGWAERYRRLPAEERSRIAMKCVIGRYLWWARKNGLPAAIIHTYTAETDDAGKVSAKPGSLRQMTNDEIRAILSR
jgi:hypothetical protein